LKTEQGGFETVNGTLTFRSGGKYQHNHTTGVGTIPTATWNTGSTCEIIGTPLTPPPWRVSRANPSISPELPQSNLGPALWWKHPDGDPRGLHWISTGTGEIRLCQNNSPVWNIGGNLRLQGGALTFRGHWVNPC
jgi:hypothetical protein